MLRPRPTIKDQLSKALKNVANLAAQKLTKPRREPPTADYEDDYVEEPGEEYEDEVADYRDYNAPEAEQYSDAYDEPPPEEPEDEEFEDFEE